MAKPEKLLDRLIPVLLLASIVFSFVVGVLWQKVRNLEKGDAIHPKARPAAEASECAFELKGEEGFWVFADKVFEDQTKLTDLSAIAVSVGVNKESFQKCVDEKRYKGKVENQYQGGVKAGITGTPGNLIINQKGEAWLIPGALPYESIKVTIDEALKS